MAKRRGIQRRGAGFGLAAPNPASRWRVKVAARVCAPKPSQISGNSLLRFDVGSHVWQLRRFVRGKHPPRHCRRGIHRAGHSGGTKSTRLSPAQRSATRRRHDGARVRHVPTRFRRRKRPSSSSPRPMTSPNSHLNCLRKGRLDEIFFVDLPRPRNGWRFSHPFGQQTRARRRKIRHGATGAGFARSLAARNREAINSALYDAFNARVRIEHRLRF